MSSSVPPPSPRDLAFSATPRPGGPKIEDPLMNLTEKMGALFRPVSAPPAQRVAPTPPPLRPMAVRPMAVRKVVKVQEPPPPSDRLLRPADRPRRPLTPCHDLESAAADASELPILDLGAPAVSAKRRRGAGAAASEPAPQPTRPLIQGRQLKKPLPRRIKKIEMAGAAAKPPSDQLPELPLASRPVRKGPRQDSLGKVKKKVPAYVTRARTNDPLRYILRELGLDGSSLQPIRTRSFSRIRS